MVLTRAELCKAGVSPIRSERDATIATDSELGHGASSSQFGIVV